MFELDNEEKELLKSRCVCRIQLFDVMLVSLLPEREALVYHWSSLGMPLSYKNRVYHPAPITQASLPCESALPLHGRPLEGRIEVWSDELGHVWNAGQYLEAELVHTLGILTKDNRMKCLLNHYNWKGQIRTYRYPHVILEFRRHSADGGEDSLLGICQKPIEMRLKLKW